jgi:hypothetical protein
MDRGANGGLAGTDVRIEEQTGRVADVTGVDDHAVNNLPIVNCSSVVNTTKGPVILRMNQYAYHAGTLRTIHSAGQIEHFKNIVDDRSRVVGGTQRVISLEGHIIPLTFHSGLPYLDMRPPTDAEFESLPHVVLTADSDWDPSILDDHDDFVDCDQGLPEDFDYTDRRINDMGDYIGCQHDLSYFDFTPDWAPSSTWYEIYLSTSAQMVTPQEEDLNAIRPKLGWAPLEVIKRTLDMTTRYARSSFGERLHKHWKSRYPALNVRC